MTPQIIGIKKSSATRRCERYCRERSIEFYLRDPTAKPLSPNELARIASAIGGYESLIDEESRFYAKRGLAYMEFDAAEELLANPELMRGPVVRTDRGIAIDPDTPELNRLFEKT